MITSTPVEVKILNWRARYHPCSQFIAPHVLREPYRQLPFTAPQTSFRLLASSVDPGLTSYGGMSQIPLS